ARSGSGSTRHRCCRCDGKPPTARTCARSISSTRAGEATIARMQFSDLDLSKRLERAEGYACVQWAEARRRVFPEHGSEWIGHGGAFAGFDGVESPVTQTFGLGLFEPLSAEVLAPIEQFFFSRGAPAQHEISPFVGVPALELLCVRGYKP